MLKSAENTCRKLNFFIFLKALKNQYYYMTINNNIKLTRLIEIPFRLITRFHDY